MNLFRMESLRKDEAAEKERMRGKRVGEMIQTKVRHLLYRAREMIIPMGGKW